MTSIPDEIVRLIESASDHQKPDTANHGQCPSCLRDIVHDVTFTTRTSPHLYIVTCSMEKCVKHGELAADILMIQRGEFPLDMGIIRWTSDYQFLSQKGVFWSEIQNTTVVRYVHTANNKLIDVRLSDLDHPIIYSKSVIPEMWWNCCYRSVGPCSKKKAGEPCTCCFKHIFGDLIKD